MISDLIDREVRLEMHNATPTIGTIVSCTRDQHNTWYSVLVDEQVVHVNSRYILLILPLRAGEVTDDGGSEDGSE